MPRIIEGVWEMIKTHESELIGRQVKLIVEDDVDLGVIPPDPPNTVRDQDHLEDLLREGMKSGSATPMTGEDWEDIRREVRARQTARDSITS